MWLCTCLKWPSHFCFPALDLCRIALLHPSIESYMLDQGTTANGDSEQLTNSGKLCVAILQHAERETEPVPTSNSELDSVADRNSILALKCCVNLFKYRTLWKISLSNMESIIQICVSSNFQACRSSKKMLEAVSAVIYNSSMVAYAYLKIAKRPLNPKLCCLQACLSPSKSIRKGGAILPLLFVGFYKPSVQSCILADRIQSFCRLRRGRISTDDCQHSFLWCRE